VTSPGGVRTEIPGADKAVLQQASENTDAVAVSTANHW